MLDKQGYTRVRTHAHTHAPCHPTARTHPRARAHTLRFCDTYCFSTARMIRQRSSALLYKYIAFLVSSILVDIFTVT